MIYDPAPISPDPITTSRFVQLMAGWRMSDEEAAFLLQQNIGVWHALRDWVPDFTMDPEAQIRMRHCLDISEAIEILEPGVDQGDWIRRPHPILNGRSPHYFLTRLDDALRSIRWNMLTETRPGFPGR